MSISWAGSVNQASNQLGKVFLHPQNLSPGDIKGSGIWQVEGDLLVVAGYGDGASPSIKKKEKGYIWGSRCVSKFGLPNKRGIDPEL